MSLSNRTTGYPKLRNLKNSVNLWKSRSLSLIGKCLIINVIGLSKLYYLARILVLPPWVPQRVNQIIWPFLWGSKIETVSRKSISCNVCDGGLGLTDFPLKCEALRVSSLVATLNDSEDKSFFLCKYFAGWHLARLSPQWATLRDNSSPHTFTPTSFYTACITTLSRLDLTFVTLTTKSIYTALSKNFTPPSLHRVWTPFLGPGFSLRDHWAKVRDPLCDNRLNDLLWLITLRGVKVRDSLYKWGYIRSDRCAICGKKETIDHCFLHCPRVKRVWAHFCPLLSAVISAKFVINLLAVFFFCFRADDKNSFVARFVIKNVIFCTWSFRNKSTFHNGREEASALIKFSLHSIKGRVKLDFHRLPREKFLRTWVVSGFCSVRNDLLVFHF